MNETKEASERIRQLEQQVEQLTAERDRLAAIVARLPLDGDCEVRLDGLRRWEPQLICDTERAASEAAGGQNE